MRQVYPISATRFDAHVLQKLGDHQTDFSVRREIGQSIRAMQTPLAKFDEFMAYVKASEKRLNEEGAPL